MVALELTNTIGFVTALIGFMSCLSRFRHTENDQWEFSTVYDWWFVLYLVSDVAFVINGLLTDGILVSQGSWLNYYLRLIINQRFDRFGVVGKS